VKKFSPDQLLVVLFIGAIVAGICVFRLIHGY